MHRKKITRIKTTFKPGTGNGTFTKFTLLLVPLKAKPQKFNWAWWRKQELGEMTQHPCPKPPHLPKWKKAHSKHSENVATGCWVEKQQEPFYKHTHRHSGTIILSCWRTQHEHSSTTAFIFVHTSHNDWVSFVEIWYHHRRRSSSSSSSLSLASYKSS